jgi:hypothetical protein
MRGGNESRDPSRTAIPTDCRPERDEAVLAVSGSMLRIFANNCELAAHYCDRGVQTFRPAPEPISAPEQRREAA